MINIKDMIRKILELLTVFFIILGCNSVYYYADEGNHITETVMILSAVLAVAELGSTPINRRFMQNYTVWLLPYLGVIFILLIVDVEGDALVGFCGRYVVFIPLMVLLFLLMRKQGFPNRILYEYSDVMSVIAAVSLFFWIFGTILHAIHPTGYINASWGTKFNYPSYFNIYFERQIDLISGLYRNQGIFVEAPMYSLALVFAIAIEIFLRKPDTSPQRNLRIQGGGMTLFVRRLNFRIVILILTLLSTFSTTGIITLIAMLYGWILINVPKTEAGRKIKNISSLIVVIVGLACAVYLFRQKSGTFSWAERESDLVSGFRAWIDSPIFGMGYENKDHVSSNSIFQILTLGGIVLGLIYFYPLVGGIVNSILRHKKNLLFLYCVVLVNFILTICGRTFLLLFLLSYFYADLIIGYRMSRNPHLVRVQSNRKFFYGQG